MAKSYWRQRACEVIGRVIARVGTSDIKQLRRALQAAYPFGERAYTPYKMWLKEVNARLAPLGSRQRFAQAQKQGEFPLFKETASGPH